MTQTDYLTKGEALLPPLFRTALRPGPETFPCKKGESLLLDLGEHRVGTFSFTMDVADDFISAPVRFVIRFGEDMREIEDDFSTFHGSLSDTWLQEETVLVDTPDRVRVPRRHSCRFIKITVENTRRNLVLSDFLFTAETSADETKLEKAETSDPLLGKLDEVACRTLRDCMQRVFEDGPKRDRRLWIGDLRLEALTSYYTYKNHDLVRRCLYLLAAGKESELGLIPSYLYETPYYFSGRDAIADYALLYTASLCDYFEHTGDEKTARELLPVARRQLSAFAALLDERGVVRPQKGWFTFIDWCPGLNGLVPLQGVYLYALRRFAAFLEALGEDSTPYEEQWARNREQIRAALLDEQSGLFTSDGQVSVHAQVWMILGGAFTPEEGKAALEKTLGKKDALQPVTPYMWHYVVESHLALGQKDKAVALLKSFWGGMLARGADTFYEVFVPEDPDFSPYKDRKLNSLCHAWSCTPAYFIRKYHLGE